MPLIKPYNKLIVIINSIWFIIDNSLAINTPIKYLRKKITRIKNIGNQLPGIQKTFFKLLYSIFFGKDNFNPIIKDNPTPINHMINAIGIIPKADKIPNIDNKIITMGKIKILLNLISLLLVWEYPKKSNTRNNMKTKLVCV